MSGSTKTSIYANSIPLFRRHFPQVILYQKADSCEWPSRTSRRCPWNILSGGECLFHDPTQESEPALICCKLPGHSFWKFIQTPPLFEVHAKWLFYRSLSLWLSPTVVACTLNTQIVHWYHSDCSVVWSDSFPILSPWMQLHIQNL